MPNQFTPSDKLKKSHPEYRHWRSMRDRCAEKNSKYFKDGIKVCERWNDFYAFLSDMGPRPGSHHTIDRIDNTKGYYPENCKWSTKSEQVINRKMMRNNTSNYRGISYRASRNQWRASIAVEGIKIEIGSYDDKEYAAYMRDQFAICLHGPNATLNVIT